MGLYTEQILLVLFFSVLVLNIAPYGAIHGAFYIKKELKLNPAEINS